MNISLLSLCAAVAQPVVRRFFNLAAATLALVSALTLHATTIIQPDFDSLVQQADYIVQAKVVSVTAEWRFDGTNKHIITKVELDVSEVVAGTPPRPLVLEMLGGKIGDQELRVDGAPQFKVGDEDILFVRGNRQQFTPLVAMEYGRFRVKQEAATGHTHISRNNGVPLYSEQEVIHPMVEDNPLASKISRADASPLTPEDFKIRIRSSRQKNSSRQP